MCSAAGTNVGFLVCLTCLCGHYGVRAGVSSQLAFNPAPVYQPIQAGASAPAQTMYDVPVGSDAAGAVNRFVTRQA